jgi:long-chain acyl-CoA synthetase
VHTHELLAIASAIVPDRVAITFDDQRWTYAEFANRANRLANALADVGVEAGDRIAVIDVNTPQHLEAYFAAARLDAIYVPLNFREHPEEMGFPLEHTAPKVLIAGERYVPLVESLRPQAASVEQFIVAGGTVNGGWVAYDDLLGSGQAEELRFPEGEPGNTAVLLFTAGTTGRPKAVMLSHDSFTSFMLSSVEPPDPDIEERTLLTLPMYHIAGLQAALASVYGGRPIVIQRQFEPWEWLNLVQQEQVARALVVPTMLKQVLDHVEFSSFNLDSLQVLTYGGASMPPSLIERAIGALPGVQFMNAFGQTETGSTIAVLRPEDHVLDGHDLVVAKRRIRLSSIGQPVADVEVRVVDEAGAELPAGETGEIIARGPRLMSGYWGKADSTAETLRGGWLYTGDLAYVDEDGYIFLQGRAKDFIKRGGEMVAPEEVENLIHGYDGVAECAVIGLPDDTWGEQVVAIVVTEAGADVTEESVKAICQEHLARFKRPERVLIVDYLPRNSLGKVLKRELREKFAGP